MQNRTKTQTNTNQIFTLTHIKDTHVLQVFRKTLVCCVSCVTDINSSLYWQLVRPQGPVYIFQGTCPISVYNILT